MLSLPDFREKHILIVNASDIKDDRLKFNNENFCLTRDGGILDQVSCHKLLAVFVLGDCSITTKLIKNCKKLGVSLFLLKENFETYAELVAVAEGNYMLRQKQYAISEEKDLSFSKKIVYNKISNQLRLIKELKKEPIEKTFADAKERVESATDNQALLGIEGSCSKIFFQEYFTEMEWLRRSPRTKVDVSNTLLDIGYTFLFNFTDTLLRLFGFDTYKGFYHKLFFQRKSLACDIMEPFRCVIDRQLLKSFHLKQIKEEDFQIFKSRYELSYDKQRAYLKVFVDAIMERKEDVFNYARDYYYFVLNGEGEFPFFEV